MTNSLASSFSLPRLLLHGEGLVVFIGSILLYADQGYSGWVFVLLLLSFDLSMVGYLVNPRLGSWGYNLAHTYISPAVLLAVAWALDAPLGLQIALIWTAHIGMDRLVGYGLKYATSFKETHLERV